MTVAADTDEEPAHKRPRFEEPAHKRPKFEDDVERCDPADAVDDEGVIANGWAIDVDATPETLQDKDLSRFALVPDEEYISVDLSDKCLHHLVPGGDAWSAKSNVQSPWAVWVTPPLLSPTECDEWVRRAEEQSLETGDFIFKAGRNGFERMKTGARRYSATSLIVDQAFAKVMQERIREAVPQSLSDGRSFRGVRESFLLTRYVEGQYFAPHFDGCMKDGGEGCMAGFTVVLFLSDDFEGGATHYLPGQGSEVSRPLALRPSQGCAIVHRVVSVLHCGGRVLKGTKYIMQFSLMYDAASADAAVNLVKPLRWGA